MFLHMSHVWITRTCVCSSTVQRSSVVKYHPYMNAVCQDFNLLPFLYKLCYRECEFFDLIRDYVNSLVTYIPCNIYNYYIYINSSVGKGSRIKHRDVWHISREIEILKYDWTPLLAKSKATSIDIHIWKGGVWTHFTLNAPEPSLWLRSYKHLSR